MSWSNCKPRSFPRTNKMINVEKRKTDRRMDVWQTTRLPDRQTQCLYDYLSESFDLLTRQIQLINTSLPVNTCLSNEPLQVSGLIECNVDNVTLEQILDRINTRDPTTIKVFAQKDWSIVVDERRFGRIANNNVYTTHLFLDTCSKEFLKQAIQRFFAIANCVAYIKNKRNDALVKHDNRHNLIYIDHDIRFDVTCHPNYLAKFIITQTEVNTFEEFCVEFDKRQ